MHAVQTHLLDIAFEQLGPENGQPIFFLHGWPDAPRSWKVIADFFASMRYRNGQPVNFNLLL